MGAPAKKIVCFIPPDGSSFVEGLGYRVCMVVDGEDGYHPSGAWPLDGKDHGPDMPGAQRPWFWGMTLEEAEERARRHNETLGISADEAFDIIGRSMTLGRRR